MNIPGRATGSWRWRLQPGALTEECAARLRESTAAAGRSEPRPARLRAVPHGRSRRHPQTRSATSTSATTTRRRRATTPSGAWTSATSARSRCSARCASCSAPSPGAVRRVAGGRQRHRLLHDPPARAPASCARPWPPTSRRGCSTTLRANARRRGRGRWRPSACDAEALPFEDASFDLVLGHAVLHHIPDLDRAFAEFAPRPAARRDAAVRRRALRATATGSPPSPSASRCARRPRGARVLGARQARTTATSTAPRATARTPSATARRSSRSSTSTRSPQATSRGRARAAGFEDVKRPRRGAARELVRLDEPHARGLRRPRGRAVGVAPVRVPRLPRAAGGRPGAARAAAAGGDLLQPHARGPQGLITAAGAPRFGRWCARGPRASRRRPSRRRSPDGARRSSPRGTGARRSPCWSAARPRARRPRARAG